jgi:hypothetical protein
MILATLAGAALIMSVATGPVIVEPQGSLSMSARQKTAAVEPLIKSATECIARAVAADPRFGTSPPRDLGELIVASIPPCVAPVRAMIDGYDSYFGDGTGEAFFMGPYLDVLPGAVSKWVAEAAR